MVKTTIEYDGDCIEVDVSDEVAEFLEQDRKRQQAQDRSDRRHFTKEPFEPEPISRKLSPNSFDETYVQVVHKMELEKLQSKLKTLTEEQRTLIYLYYYEDWSMEKIGQHFGISKMAVSKRHSKVIKQLRELMET